jgi:hypothetical protein
MNPTFTKGIIMNNPSNGQQGSSNQQGQKFPSTGKPGENKKEGQAGQNNSSEQKTGLNEETENSANKNSDPSGGQSGKAAGNRS